MSAIKIEDIYQELLNGKRKQFPPYRWSEDIDRNLIKTIIKYLVEIVLNWDDNMLKEKWNKKLIKWCCLYNLSRKLIWVPLQS
ncbi:hypothetical protein [Bacillus cereus]|uniref:hypothetical protein n=1 Tax=Bacillus cereus TaxID=1396 RepID=UPI002110ED6C|nr:hypothetical protein [Bacillus cereus]